MNCIILDDEPHAIDVLKRYVEQTPSLTLMQTFRNPLKALAFLQETSVDLVFLDVNMPNLTGMQFLQALKHKPLIIFTTAYSTYAAESYEWDAVDYLVKPILLERFLKAVGKAHDQFKGAKPEPTAVMPQAVQDDTILLKSGTQTHRVKLSEILYVVKESNYLSVNTTDKKVLIRANMNTIFSWLPQDQFCRIHKSYVVGIKHIDIVESHQIMVNGLALPLGPSYRRDFLSQLEG